MSREILPGGVPQKRYKKLLLLSANVLLVPSLLIWRLCLCSSACFETACVPLVARIGLRLEEGSPLLAHSLASIDLAYQDCSRLSSQSKFMSQLSSSFMSTHTPLATRPLPLSLVCREGRPLRHRQAPRRTSPKTYPVTRKPTLPRPATSIQRQEGHACQPAYPQRGRPHNAGSPTKTNMAWL